MNTRSQIGEAFPFANTDTTLTVPAVPDCIQLVEWMSVQAVCATCVLRRRACATQQINPKRDGFQVQWVYAHPIPTEMVNDQIGRNWSNQLFVCPAMWKCSTTATASEAEGLSITFIGGVSSPGPTTTEVRAMRWD